MFTAIVAVGCGKEQSVNIVPDTPEKVEANEKQVSIHASVKETKVLADNAGAFKWQNGDKITVVTAADVIREFTTTDTDIEADFSGTIPDADNVGAYALYPASDNHVAVGDMLAFNLDAEVVWNPNTSNMPMLGKISGSSASFKAVGGVLKLVLYNIPAEADYLQFVAKTKKITGEFDIDDATAANVVIETKVADNAAEKELLIDFSGDYSDRKVFYIPLPTGTIDGFTINLLDSGKNVIFTQTTKDGVNLVVAANHLILGPALNCAKDVLLWDETFELYNANEVPSGEEGTGFGGADITYSCTDGGSATKIYSEALAGGTAPELLVSKGSGSFKAAGIPTNGAATMSLTFRENAGRITVSSTTEGVTISSPSFSSNKYTATINNSNNASTIDLVFTNPQSSNVRVDDISLIAPGSAYAVPTIETGSDVLTVAVGNTSASTSYSLSDPVDDLGVSYILSGANTSWISSIALSADRVSVTATGNSNHNADDNTATLTLKASGAKDKVLSLTQKSALVHKPATVNVLPGNASVTVSWTKDSHATSYLAYICTSSGLSDPTIGILLSPELDGSTYTATQTGLTNGETYYVYVKVNEVSTNYVAEDAWAVSEGVVPEGKTYYEKVTSAPDDWSGTYLLVDGAAGKAATGVWNGTSGIKAASVSIAAGKILRTDTVDDYAVTIAKVGETSNYTIYFAGTSLYAGYTGSSNTCASFASSTDNKTKWTLSLSSSNVVITNVGTSTRKLRCNSSGVVDDNGPFRCYTNTTGNDIQLYKLEDSRTSSGIAWSKASDNATILTGADEMPTVSLVNPHSLPINYSSSVTSVATINSSSGELTLVGVGSTVISARFSGDATYAPANVSYTLTVAEGRTTCAAPTFSPAEGEVAENTNVTVSSTTTGSTIYYTIDGSTPTTSSSHGTVGAASAVITINEAKTINAIAVKDDWLTSAVSTATYSLPGSGIDPESIDFSTLGLTNGTAYNDPFDGGHFTVTFSDAGSANNGKYYDTGTAIRSYGGDQFTVASSNVITKIELTFGSGDGSNTITTNVGSFDTDTWTGSALSVTFTVGGSSGHRRIKKIKVTYGSGSGGGGGGGTEPPTPSSLPKYLGCYEMPAVEDILSGSSTSGNYSDRDDVWYRYETNNNNRQIATHTFTHPTSSTEQRTYTVLYDQNKYAPVWTAHAMHSSMWPDENVGRNDSWTTDPAISLTQQTGLDNANGVGYSRGHLVASNYRQTSVKQNKQTFYYSNQAPQWQNNFNSGIWSSLEEDVASHAPSGRDTLYVITGVLYEGNVTTLPSGGLNVPIPSHFYKCLMKCTFNAQGAMTGASGCAYVFTNEAHTSGTYSSGITTIDAIEARAGFDFFANVPTSLQTTAEAQSASLW